MCAIASAVPRVATIRKPLSCKVWATAFTPALSESVTVMNAVPSLGSGTPAAACAFGEGGGKVARDPHHLAGGAHLRAEHRVGALKPVERQHRLLHRHVLAVAHALPPGRQIHVCP